MAWPKRRLLVWASPPVSDASHPSNNKLKATLAATITFDDTSTTRTEVSTDKELKRATTYLRNFQIIFRQLD